MNGIHDMGGMEGFGPVEPEANEPVFHAEWEARVYGLVNALFGTAKINVDEFRHAIERIPPARYLASPYYERWMQAVETLLVEHGIVTRAEIAALPQPDHSSIAPPAAAPPAKLSHSTRPRFAAGDRVRVRNINPPGHTRSPRYVRGKAGTIRRDYGSYVFPDTNAHHAGENRQHVYSVEFTARELWGKAARERIMRERVMIDLWEGYLEPAVKKPATKKRKR
ncbi:MAG: nitrile hydratase subunit beta [Candidatus Binataceae bacterium]